MSSTNSPGPRNTSDLNQKPESSSSSGSIHEFQNDIEDNSGLNKTSTNQSLGRLSRISTKASVAVQRAVHIFDSSLRKHHKSVFLQFIPVVLLMFTLVLATLSIYWGSNYRRNERVHNLNIWVLDWDEGYNGTSPIVGPKLIESVNSFIGPKTNLGYQIYNKSNFNYSIETLHHEVKNEKVWGIIVINSNATKSLISARDEVNTSFNSDYLIQFIYAQARQETIFATMIMPRIELLNNAFSKSFSNEFVSNLTQELSSSDFVKLGSNAPQLLTHPISITNVNVIPFTGDVTQVLVQVGLIFLIIVSFFQFNFFGQIQMVMMGKVPFIQYLGYRIAINLLSYFFLSLSYSLVSLAFQVDFTHKYGKGGFVVFWMMNWIIMTALGGATENFCIIAFSSFPPILGFGLITWVLLNSSTAFAPFELMPHVFKFGYMMPIFQAVHYNRTILFGTKSIIGRNIGILFAWIVINSCVLPLCLLFAKNRKIAAAKKAALIEK